MACNLCFVLAWSSYIFYHIHYIAASGAGGSKNLWLKRIRRVCQLHILILITNTNEIISPLKWVIDMLSIYIDEILSCTTPELLDGTFNILRRQSLYYVLLWTIPIQILKKSWLVESLWNIVSFILWTPYSIIKKYASFIKTNVWKSGGICFHF